MIGIILLIIATILLLFLIWYIKKSKIEEKTYEQQKNNNVSYKIKANYLTETEKSYYKVIESIIDNKYTIYPQIPLSQIIEKNSDSKYRTELYRIIDIGIFEKETLKPLLCIEINDETHHEYNRYKRDQKVKNILEKANMPLITLWTEYGINYDYIKKRIKEHIKID